VVAISIDLSAASIVSFCGLIPIAADDILRVVAPVHLHLPEQLIAAEVLGARPLSALPVLPTVVRIRVAKKVKGGLHLVAQTF